MEFPVHEHIPRVSSDCNDPRFGAAHYRLVVTPVETARTRPSACVRARSAFHGLIFTPVETAVLGLRPACGLAPRSTG